MSDELLRNEELLDVEGHMKKGAGEPEDKGENEVEAHLLEANLLEKNLLEEQLDL
jgi:hypothetical protein